MDLNSILLKCFMYIDIWDGVVDNCYDLYDDTDDSSDSHAIDYVLTD